jgi:hypothetical protein
MTDPATAGVPAAMSDPVGVTVAVIRHADPSLPTAMLEQIVAGVAASRPKRRRLAQALTDRPGVLTDGRSPAPRVVGDLLLALRRHCAGRISPPICATCGKALRSLARRGDDWFCGCCARPNEQCSACHKSRPVCSRDEQGRPRCQPCSPTDDPVRLVHAVVAALDPAVTEETIREAMAAVGQRSGVRRQVAWAVRARPDLLTGAGAQTPVPGVLRLIAQLKRAGVRGLVTPACPRCERMVVLRDSLTGGGSATAAGTRSARRHAADAAPSGPGTPAGPTGRCGARPAQATTRRTSNRAPAAAAPGRSGPGHRKGRSATPAGPGRC